MMTDATPTPPPPPPASPTPIGVPRGASPWRIVLIVGGLAVFLVVTLWAVRNNIAAGDLAVGTCFDLPSQSGDFSTVARHDCNDAHDAEVFHVVEFTEPTYPVTSLRRNSFVDEQCFPVFATYVGKGIDAVETLNIGYFFPTSDGWDSGDRTFTCYAVRVDGSKLTKSLKGSGGL
jgi:hypothetical protein